eukprot:GFYU01019484.1.p1 GENE.GFYU01019484.1~~GFYU01019484.1.p1  ORF type:complete len:261 (-),score=67.17 GFYU01019484.1:228-1010(-)
MSGPSSPAPLLFESMFSSEQRDALNEMMARVSDGQAAMTASTSASVVEKTEVKGRATISIRAERRLVEEENYLQPLVSPTMDRLCAYEKSPERIAKEKRIAERKREAAEKRRIEAQDERDARRAWGVSPVRTYDIEPRKPRRLPVEAVKPKAAAPKQLSAAEKLLLGMSGSSPSPSKSPAAASGSGSAVTVPVAPLRSEFESSIDETPSAHKNNPIVLQAGAPVVPQTPALFRALHTVPPRKLGSGYDVLDSDNESGSDE